MKKIITAIIASLVIVGCSGGLRGKSNLVQPTELNSAIPSNVVIKNWEAKTGSKTSQDSNLRFLIANDGASTLYIAGQKGVVTAIDMNSGTKTWETKIGSPLYTGIDYSQGVLLVGRQDAYVEAISATTGEKLWEKKVLGVPAVSPVANDNIAIVRTLFGAVETFDLQTGNDSWAYIFNNSELSVLGAAPPAFLNNDVLIASDEGTLALLDTRTGEAKWGTVLSQPVNASFMGGLRDVDAGIVVTNDRIFVGQYLSGITALNHQGQKLWQKGQGTYAGLVFTGNSVVSVERDSTIQALDAQDGAPLWSNRDLRGRNLTKPVLVGNRIVVGDYQGFVHVLDSTTGQLQGSSKIGSTGFLLDIREINGSVYLLDHSGTLYKVSI